MAGGPGFEPRLTESESAVLPLNYPPMRAPRFSRKGAARSIAKRASWRKRGPGSRLTIPWGLLARTMAEVLGEGQSGKVAVVSLMVVQVLEGVDGFSDFSDVN